MRPLTSVAKGNRFQGDVVATPRSSTALYTGASLTNGMTGGYVEVHVPCIAVGARRRRALSLPQTQEVSQRSRSAHGERPPSGVRA